MMDRVLSWSFALGLAAFLLFMSFQKFFGLDPNPVFGLIEARSGIALVDPWLRWLTGLLELVAAGLVIWPATRIRGAMLGALVALGAIAFHLSPWLGWRVPLPEQASAALAAGATPEQMANLPTDQGALFLLALVIGALAVASYVTERNLVRQKSRKDHSPAMGALA